MNLIKLEKVKPDIKAAARIFKILSVETRVRIFCLLKHRSLCVNALAEILNISPAAVSQHLRVFRDADLVSSSRKGFFIHYRVNEDTLADWNTRVRLILEPDDNKDKK